jgi:hypothetical protein
MYYLLVCLSLTEKNDEVYYTCFYCHYSNRPDVKFVRLREALNR